MQKSVSRVLGLNLHIICSGGLRTVIRSFANDNAWSDSTSWFARSQLRQLQKPLRHGIVRPQWIQAESCFASFSYSQSASSVLSASIGSSQRDLASRKLPSASRNGAVALQVNPPIRALPSGHSVSVPAGPFVCLGAESWGCTRRWKGSQSSGPTGTRERPCRLSFVSASPPSPVTIHRYQTDLRKQR